jgi:type IV secretory pathway VirD2 relaxase
MTRRDDEIRIKPGRVRSSDRGVKRPRSFVGEVMRAAKKAGYTGKGFGRVEGSKSRSSFGRGRRAALALSSRSPGRRVIVMARVVRHRGRRFIAAPLAKHITYLKREGVSRNGEWAQLVDAGSDRADGNAFAERCAEDRHHFRFIVSPEDATQMTDLRAFTRELMTDVERDLGTKLDWVAVDHWNTDNPHVHVLVRGRADGRDLVISRNYMSHGLRQRAAERVVFELGPRSETEIRAALDKEVEAERWTSLDRALRDIADESAGFLDLRPSAGGEDPELRRLLVGRAGKLERLGFTEPIGSAQWSLKPGIEPALRDLGVRGDIIKTMHQAIRGLGREPDVSAFALHGEEPAVPIVGRLVERGLDNELKGTAYAIVDGVDGRTHHLRFADLELTGDATPGAIVEVRLYDDANGRKRRLSLATRSDLAIEEQVAASGATWLDRQLVAREPTATTGGFGVEVRNAMDRRLENLIEQGFASRQGQRIAFARDLLNTLRRRELDRAIATLSAETGLAHEPSGEGERVAGVYRQRLILSSGRFAMIDGGLGFQLVPWRPALEQRLGQQVSGVMTASGVEWESARQRGLGLWA